jgi:hypothetical protein
MGGTNAAELVGREPAEFEEQIPPDDSPANIAIAILCEHGAKEQQRCREMRPTQ